MADYSGPKVGAAGFSGVVVVLLGLVMPFEGKSNVSYIPIPGDVPTICYGETHGVQLGERKSDAECVALLRDRLALTLQDMDALVRVPLPPGRRAALADFVYNEGLGAFERSSILRDLNAGRTTAACNDLLKYEYAEGRKLQGLQRRREAERVLCLEEGDESGSG